MALCKKCGQEVPDESKFCPNCGAKMNEEANEVKEEPNEQAGKETEKKEDSEFVRELKNLNNTKDSTDEFDAKDIEDNKVMAVLAYLSWLVLIPLFAAKDSKFARFHCNQGIVLAIGEFLAWVVFGILSLIPYVGILFAICEWLMSVACFVFAVIGIVNAVNGKAKELPVFGKYKILK